MEDLGRALSHLSALDSFLVLLQDADTDKKKHLDLYDVSAGFALILGQVRQEIEAIRDRLGSVTLDGRTGQPIGIMEGANE